MSFEIQEVARGDRAAFDDWHAIETAADLYDRPDTARPSSLEGSRAGYDDQPDTRVARSWVAREDGVPVAAGDVWFSLLDNLTSAFVDLRVHPDHRRRGYGTRMVAHIEPVMAELGRTIISANVIYAPDVELADAGNFRFALSCGYAAANSELRRRLTLPADRTRLELLAARAAERHEGYRIVAFMGAVPDELLLGFATLDALVDFESPVGDLEVEPGAPDPDGIRHYEAQAREQGRQMWGAVAVAPDGEVVAMTQLWQALGVPTTINQSGTIVRRDHRGHRLGMAVKVANLLQVGDGFEEITTWNAASNEHMVAVNDQLGFVVIERAEMLQKKLP
jgi:GNAT superfamily N-acetyltransferase